MSLRRVFWGRKERPRRDDWKQQQFEMVFAELARRRSEQDRRAVGAESRAGVLIAAAAIVTGLFGVVPSDSVGGVPSNLMLAAMCLSVVAAGFGIAAMFPRQVQDSNVRRVVDDFLNADVVAVKENLYALHVRFIEQQDQAILKRLRLIQWGLLALGGSLLFAACAMMLQTLGGVK